MKIFKYPLVITDRQTITMPFGAEILHVAMQNGTLMLWAMVDNQNAPEHRFFEIIGTGNPIDATGPGVIPIKRTYLGTVHVNSFVWHVFER